MGDSMGDHIDRRGLIAGATAAAVLGATPALAQFPNSIGGFNTGNLGNMVGQFSDVMAGMNLTEADEIALGEGYYERFIDESGGRYNSRADQEALHRFA